MSGYYDEARFEEVDQFTKLCRPRPLETEKRKGSNFRRMDGRFKGEGHSFIDRGNDYLSSKFMTSSVIVVVLSKPKDTIHK